MQLGKRFRPPTDKQVGNIARDMGAFLVNITTYMPAVVYGSIIYINGNGL
jgi:hypothetical protein